MSVSNNETVSVMRHDKNLVVASKVRGALVKMSVASSRLNCDEVLYWIDRRYFKTVGRHSINRDRVGAVSSVRFLDSERCEARYFFCLTLNRDSI